jgi:DNA-binding beta-propeller fold protein YncE
MVMKSLLKILAVLGLVILLVQCGKKIKLPTSLPHSQDKTLDTTYVQIWPVWDEAGGIPFNKPQDVHIGYDTYVYIADTENDRIVKLDRRGKFIDQYPVPHPISLAQDPLLRMAAVSGDNKIYLKNIFEAKPFHEVFAFEPWMDTLVFLVDSSFVIDSTFYPDSLDTILVGVDTLDVLVDTVNVSIKAIAATPIPDEEYLFFTCDQTSHTYPGPGGEKNQRDQISLFVPKFEDTLLVFKYGEAAVPKGGDLGKTISPTGIFTYPHRDHFRMTFTQGYTPGSVQVLSGDNYRPVIARTDSTEIYFPGMFGVAEDVAVDEFGNIYVVDVSRHSVLKFNPRGRLLLRFGSFGSENKEFNRPKGIAYYNKTLYVADTENNRILRFKLSTDIRK